MAKKKSSEQAIFTEDWLPIINVTNGLIEVKGGALEGKQYVTGVRIEPKNIFILSQQEQDNTIVALRDFYNTIDYEFWLLCCDRPVDISMYKTELELMYAKSQDPQNRKLVLEDISKCEKFVGPEYNAVDTEFYLLFKDSVKNKEGIQKKVYNLISGLASCGLVSRQITDEDARALLDGFFNDGQKVEFGTVMADV